MRLVDRIARMLAFALLLVAWTDGDAAEFTAPADDGWHVWQVQGTAGGDIDGDQLSIYVRIDAGRVTRIRARTSNCPVTTRTAVNDMGAVSNSASVGWLLRQVDADSQVADGALAAISAHAGDDAFVALTALLEDRDRRQKTREQALFWLAQSESEQAFDYLDALLSSN